MGKKRVHQGERWHSILSNLKLSHSFTCQKLQLHLDRNHACLPGSELANFLVAAPVVSSKYVYIDEVTESDILLQNLLGTFVFGFLDANSVLE